MVSSVRNPNLTIVVHLTFQNLQFHSCQNVRMPQNLTPNAIHITLGCIKEVLINRNLA